VLIAILFGTVYMYPTDNQSFHYYKNRYSSQERLVGTLDNWITLGSTFELYFAKP
jgi:hypothetical protein